MTFTRRKTDNWTTGVPGARWLKADLQIHTMDDLPGGMAKIPPGISGDPHSASTTRTYARMFLQSAASNGVRVLGLTPHSPRIDPAQDSSAVWQIVEEWNSGFDDDGVPFRETIYAVFPGFEPCLKDGRSGLHLLFLFDPEIGRTAYLKAFDLVMGGVTPWQDGQLQMSNRSSDQAFSDLQKFQNRECPRTQDGRLLWDYIVLAPHIDGEKGLLGAQKAQILRLFQHDGIAGLELGDHKLPDDTLRGRPWLKDGMATYRQTFLHSSDAYSVDEIGRRHVWIKLASPRIESLRQAFIASDSRVRLGYQRDANGNLSEIPDLPDVTMNNRPWLKSVSVSGKASFFGAGGGDDQDSHFNFSPDLTCVIGGSMTGKSTLLDGLRVHVNAQMPHDSSVLEQVEARGRTRFLGGSARVVLDCPGRDPTAAPHEQWPAIFYAQTELQRLAQSAGAVEDILARLVASETQDIMDREKRLSDLDGELSRASVRLGKLGGDVADAEQAAQRSQRAANELAAFSDAGLENLNRVSGELSRWQGSAQAATELASELDCLLDSLSAVDVPELDKDLAAALQTSELTEREADLQKRWDSVLRSLRNAKDELAEANAAIESITGVLGSHRDAVRVQMDRDLAALGLDGAKINQLQALTAQASLLGSYQEHAKEQSSALLRAERAFEALLKERRDIVEEQRSAFGRVMEVVHSQFDGRIVARRIDEGRKMTLDRFLRGLNQRGITRWWNDLPDDQRPTPDELLDKLVSGHLEDVEMSSAVSETFRVQLTPTRQREMAALRCPDDYALELRMDDGSHRPLSDLSGGQRVNLLLSLLLETDDDRPLVIDQPEDELDNRFMFETMIPALKRLKGRRQIIVATHNANIVVNGDADQVILLEATADHGHIACSGAIEEPDIRDAIVRTVDGGDEAFRLRRLKYGF